MNSTHPFEQLQHAFRSFLAKHFPEQDLAAVEVTLNVDPAREQFGDLSSNAALIIARATRTNPRHLAEELCTAFIHPAVARIEVAGPGFLNIFCRPELFQETLQLLHAQGRQLYRLQPDEAKIRYSCEFVSANPTGPLHIGHGRNGIIGDLLARVVKFLGHSATSEFYINDAGNQMVLLARSLRARCAEQLGQEWSIPEGGYQGSYLVEIAQHCIAEHGAAVLAQPESFFADYAREELLAQQRATLDRYRIVFDIWFSERQLHETGAIEQVLQKLVARGAAYEQDGALWLKASTLGDEKDRVVRRSSGEYTYVAADIAYLENKIARGFQKLIIVVGQDHHGYVARLKAALVALGHDPAMLDVILYQVVTLKNEGEVLKLSKRAGRIVSLADIIDTVGADVARFFYLNRKADAHLDFDIQLACKHTDENPVYYVQYAYVRTGSILEKSLLRLSTPTGLAGFEGQASQDLRFANIGSSDVAALTPAEHLLIKKMISLKGLLRHIASSYQTHMLAYYVIELTHMFHGYYATHRVIDSAHPEQTRARLLMIMVLRDTLKLCFELLGISVPERM